MAETRQSQQPTSNLIAKSPSRSNKGQGGKGKAKGDGGAKPKGAGRLRGRDNESEEVRISKTVSWLLRHGAQGEGLKMRPDGYAKVDDVLANQKLKSLDFLGLQSIVKADSKQRYDLIYENIASPTSAASVPEAATSVVGQGTWWIRANQGHSIKSVELDLQPITSLSDIPTRLAVHGTTRKAWESISQQGLSKMTRNHIHLAQGLPGEKVISGMRSSSQILIYIDIEKALSAGLEFFLSKNGAVLTPGDERGFLGTEFFKRVETAKMVPLPGWEGP